MVKLLSYFDESDIMEFNQGKEGEINNTLMEHNLRNCTDDVKKKALDLLTHKKTSKNLSLTKGFALTHLRLDEVDDIKMAIGVFSHPVKIPRGKEIKALFSIVIPENKCQTYLSLIAHLTRLLSGKDALGVFRVDNRQGIIEFIRRFEEN